MRKTYNIFIVFGTLPSLYAQINAVKDNKTETYMWTRSCGYFDNTKVSSIKHYYKMTGYDIDFINEHYNNIIEQINKIKEKDSTAFFNIICDDCRVQFLIHILESCSIKKDDYKLTLILDGTLTEMNYRLLQKDYETVSAEKWNYLSELAKNDFDKYKKEIIHLFNFAFFVSTWPNVKLLTCHKELLKNNVISDTDKNKMNIENFDFEKVFKELPIKMQKIFFGDVLTKEMLTVLTSSKKNLIITGTYHFGYEDVTYVVYEQLILKALYCIDKDTTVWYKAHPLYPADTIPQFKDFLNSNNIKILPPKFPLEVLLWHFDNIDLGGFCSTTYSLINPKRVKFFFGELFSFIKSLYDKKLFDVPIFNFEVSQKFAATISKYYYQNEELHNKCKYESENIKMIEGKIKNLEKELLNAKKEIENLNSSLFKKIKNKLIRKKDAK